MTYMYEKEQELLVRYGIVLRRYNEVYAEKKRLEKEMQSIVDARIEECGRTGKTINERE